MPHDSRILWFLWVFFSMTNRRILLQFHDVFLKYLIKLCALAYAFLAFNSLLLSQQHGFREECLLKTLL